MESELIKEVNAMEVLQKSRLFQGMSPEEINGVFGCMDAKEQCYEKGSFIVNQGDRMSQLYVVVKGMVHIIKSDYWGNQTIMSEAGPGEIFGEAYACAGAESQVAVRAVEDTAVYRLDVHKILTVCPSSCACHNRMITNLVSAMAQKNILLTEKIEHMSQRTTRKKLLSYLSAQAQKTGKVSFTIPFNRQELADYLSVDRSAMSAELSRLKEENILDYHKNYFIFR